jgi:hypothetical protein
VCFEPLTRTNTLCHCSASHCGSDRHGAGASAWLICSRRLAVSFLQAFKRSSKHNHISRYTSTGRRLPARPGPGPPLLKFKFNLTRKFCHSGFHCQWDRRHGATGSGTVRMESTAKERSTSLGTTSSSCTTTTSTSGVHTSRLGTKLAVLKVQLIVQ